MNWEKKSAVWDGLHRPVLSYAQFCGNYGLWLFVLTIA